MAKEEDEDEFSDGGPRRQQLPDEVATYVRELIMSGQVKPGEFLRMEPLAEAIGVSNTPVREGLLALRSEGFVRLVPRRGFVVARVSQQDVRDLFWAQAQVAAELSARAAKLITPAAIARLEAIDEEFERAVAIDDQQRTANLGHEFHREINLAADSHRLSLLLASIVKQLPSHFYATIEGQVAATRNDHPLLIEALRNGDSREARSLTAQHILDGADGVVETLHARGLWADDEESAS